MNDNIAIKVDHLSKTFTNQKAVDNVSFTVKEGEIFGLLGPNGAGKTTLLRMITTLLKPTDGTVTVFGHDIEKDDKLARSTFGVTGQYASVDEDLSAKENLMIFSRLNGFSKKSSLARTDELLKEFSLENSADKSIKEFSGGMRRRLDLAISLITRPALIFLDEPTTGLDPRTRSQMWDTIRSLVKQGSTIFLTTQYLEEADKLANRVAVIDHGKLIKIGTPDQLKHDTGESTLSLKVLDDNSIHQAAEILQIELNSKPQIINNTIIVKFKNSEQAIKGLFQLKNSKINISDLIIQEPSLDDAFMALTVGKN
ncbi:ATP-binding cassette domain-containing protein [Companilactobacillus nuruki]|uniref:ABC transporter ATP-binding protein n=1 Tax=Companilactobacillus nuruki TaxID=1993540 RepID=A0A2N7ATN5_9LACO|nr:ATP-binding cassette domain-containing protein [Companilactobacillus nuruki]PMD69819.1 ABC transporter ATP-binding protein [Companilactobacillus nuruki]